ncbi:MAG: hypothetical protein IKL09_03350, partial [Clostridia bacterium]|nr:hypothetical protein [Clostridia bacterium]
DAENKVSYIGSTSTSKQYPNVDAVKSYVKNYTGVKDIGNNPDFDNFTSSGIYKYCIYDSYRDGAFYEYSGYIGLLLVSYHDISGMILGAEPCYYQVRLENRSAGLKMFYRKYNGDIYGDNVQEWSEWQDVTSVSESKAANTYATKEELTAAIGEALEGEY